MIADLEKNGPIESSDFEVCIIGAGIAGITLAVNLARNGVRTVLLEAGGRRYSARDQDAYLGEVGEGLNYTGLYDGRFRTLGGSSTQWAGQILELDGFIFERRAWVPGSGWPFPKSKLLPYYEYARSIEGLADAPKSASQIWNDRGAEAPRLGPDLVSAFSNFTLTTNFASHYSDRLQREPRLAVYIHANACEFVLESDNATVLGVRCRTRRGDETIFRARFFVLCVGAIEASRLLLQPRTDRAMWPWNRHDLVGRHFQDHLLCYVADVLDPNPAFSKMYLDFFAQGRFRFQHKIKLALPAQRRLQTLDIAGFITSLTGGYDDMAHAYETVRWIRTRRFEKLTPSRLAHLATHLHKLLWHRMPYSRQIGGGSSREALKLNVSCEQSPLSQGRITLGSRRDSLGLLRVKVNWRSSEQEIYSIRKYVEVVRNEFEQGGFGQVRPNPSLQSDDELSSMFRDSFHHIGGTRMATSESLGVVDPDLRIFGTTNAYVCSTSVFPSAGFANPTHTLLALTLRLEQHLKRLTSPRLGDNRTS